MIVPHRFRAPRQHGAILAEPPLEQVGELLVHNRQWLQAATGDVLGMPLHELRQQARRAAVAVAQDYLHSCAEPVREVSVRDAETLLFAGHQPELFHPGVWVKNFALNGLARAHGGTPVNLVVDTDNVKATALKVPGWETADPVPRCPPESVHRLTFPFDRWTHEVPYEERPVLDEALFTDLPQRVAPYLRGWTYEPMFGQFWNEVVGQSGLLGERIVRARRAWERRWGCHNLEVPMSRLCQSEPFIRFACHLLAELPRFHATYNECVHEYRRANGIRDRSHPVPDLAADGDWLEAPFWAWRRGQLRRERLFSRSVGGEVHLRFGNQTGLTLALPPHGDIGRALAHWREWEQAGLKIRSRALTTTLFARVFLADLFIHGIGGGKYDEITDMLIRRFYRVEPPAYAVLSATLLLPLPTYSSQPEQCQMGTKELRDMRWNPQRHLPPETRADAAVSGLAERKRALIAQNPAEPPARRRRFEDLREVTARLRTVLAGEEKARQEAVGRCAAEVRANAVLTRRDYAFCLYPADTLRDFLTSFL